MADPHHLERFMQNVGDWNVWREEHPEITPDLSETWLHGAYHGGLDRRNINLRGADLHQINFECDMSFYEADFRETNLQRARFFDINFSRANFQRAMLNHVTFFSIDLIEANLSKTDLRETIFEVHPGFDPLDGKAYPISRAGDGNSSSRICGVGRRSHEHWAGSDGKLFWNCIA